MNLLHTKKINVSIALTFTLFFFIGLCANAFAQETIATSSEQSPATTTAETSSLSERSFSIQKQNRLTNLSANISNRFDALVSRLQNIATRLESRANKMEQQGYEVTSARTSLTTAQQSMQKAQDNLVAIDTLVATFVSAEKHSETLIELKDRYITIYTDILETKRNLTDALIALKSTSMTETSQSTSTVSAANEQ